MVLVSHKHKFIFLKTRKTASTSVEMLLEPFCVAEGHAATEETQAIVSDAGIIGTRLVPKSRRTAQSRLWYNHMPASEISHNLGSDLFDAYAKVTTIRNPFERLVSEYYYKQHRSEARFLPGPVKQLMAKSKNPDQQSEISHFRKWLHRGRWKSDADIVFLNGKFIPDILIRFERLAEDLCKMATELGLSLDAAALPVTKSLSASRKSIPVSAYFGPREVDIVQQREAWSFDIAGYPAIPNPHEVTQ